MLTTAARVWTVGQLSYGNVPNMSNVWNFLRVELVGDVGLPTILNSDMKILFIFFFFKIVYFSFFLRKVSYLLGLGIIPCGLQLCFAWTIIESRRYYTLFCFLRICAIKMRHVSAVFLHEKVYYYFILLEIMHQNDESVI